MHKMYNCESRSHAVPQFILGIFVDISKYSEKKEGWTLKESPLDEVKSPSDAAVCFQHGSMFETQALWATVFSQCLLLTIVFKCLL